jgi:hypothetical protein
VFSKGCRVVCVDPGDYERKGLLTRGKVYVVTRGYRDLSDDDFIEIEGDQEYMISCFASRFTSVSSKRTRNLPAWF